jgi:aromatic-L-amino-acid/L-tryptophan decarboxylase
MTNAGKICIAEDRSLELSGSEMSRIVSLVMSRLTTNLDTLDTAPVGLSLDSLENARTVVEPLPQIGTSAESVLETFFEDLLPESVNTASPNYFGYIPGGGLPHAAIADLLADTVNRYIGVRAAAPAFAQLEETVVRWLCDIVGLGPSAGGFLTSGGSLANWSAVVTALHTRFDEHNTGGLIYASDQTHHSIKKAVALAGLPISNVRCIPSDESFRIRVNDLSEAILHDRRRGFAPFLIVGNAGTTNSGAVDDLDTLAGIAKEEGLWFHVDAAYGGFFALTEHGRPALTGLSQADSITLDPHKGLFLPYGTGSLLARNVDDLRRVHSLPAPYLPTSADEGDSVSLADISPELTREFRALRIWIPFKMHGIGPFRRNLEEKLLLARWLSDEIKKLSHVELIAEPQLSTVVFRILPDGCDKAATNRINERAVRFINERRRIFLTSTTLGSKVVLRVCILSFRTHRKHVEQCLQEISAAACQFGQNR